MKELALRAAAIALGVALAGVLLEGVLRWLGGPPQQVTGVVEPYRAPAHAPHFRTAVHPERRAREFTLWAIGDSFTWGDGVYHWDTWPRRLEYLIESLDSQVDVKLSVISRPGWNTVQQLEAIERRLEKYEADLMVIGFCLNDAERRNREGLEAIERPMKFRLPRNGAGRWLFANSRLMSALWTRKEVARQRRAIRHYYAEIYRREGWGYAQQALDRFRRLSWDRGIPLAAAVFPIFDQQLDDDYDYAELHRTAVGAFRQRDIPVIDLLPAYRGIDARRLAVDPFADPHPNELAHRIAAQFIARFLIEQDLTPVDPSRASRLEVSFPRPRGAR